MSDDETALRLQHLLDLRRPDDALRLLAPALVAHPDSARLLSLAAHARLLRHEPEEAVDLATRAAASAPDDEWPHRLRSIGLLALGQVDQAVDSAYRSVQLSPFLYLTHLQYARSLSRVGSPQARAQAWDEGRRAVELAPDEPAVHVLMADLAYPADGAPPPALWVAQEALQRALALDPGNAVALNDLARVRLGLGRTADAVGGFSDALTADPSSALALDNVAVALSRVIVPMYWVVGIGAFVSLGASGPDLGGFGRGSQAGVAALLLGLAGVASWRLRRRVRSRLGLFVREASRRNRPGTLAVGTLAVAGALVVLGPVLPDVVRPPVAALAMGLVVALTAVLMVWAGVVHIRGLVRAQG